MMKESGIEWIGEIPEKWGIESIGRHFENRNEKVSDYDYAPLSVTKSGVVPQLDEVAKSNAHEDRKLVRRGDFVINSRSDRKQSCGLSSYDGSVSLINLVLVPHGEIDSLYSSYLFNNYGFAEEFYRWGTGIVADLWSTKWDLMRRINVPVPPIAEQKKIADFLDGKCAEIDELVQTEEKMIEGLKAYKQSVITEAVTKGLNPSAPMKDSGIEWIGEIPITWDVRRAKQLFATLSGNGLSTDLQVDDGIPFYKAGDISTCDKFLEVAKSCVESNIAEERNFNIIPATSIVFAKIGEAMKKNSRAITTIECCIDNNCQALIPKRVDCIFAYYLMLCIDMRWFDNAGTLPCVSVYKLMQSSMPYPHPDEQKQIADYLDEKCAKIDEIIALRTEQINQLKEYKKSLIYEYVTGKKEAV